MEFIMSDKTFKYIVNLNERGDFFAHVEDSAEKEVYRIASSEQLSDLIECGYMEGFDDVQGLLDHLESLDLLPPNSTIEPFL